MSEEKQRSESSKDHHSRHRDDRSHRHHYRHSSHRHHSHRSDRERSSRDERDRHRDREHRHGHGHSRSHCDDYRERESKKDSKPEDEFEGEYEFVEPKESDTNMSFNHEPVDQSKLNELNANILKAKLRKSEDLPRLEKEYEELKAKFYAQHKQGEAVKQQNDAFKIKRNFSSTKDINDMTIEDMVREEKTTSGLQRSDMQNIIKDKKFSTDLDYQDDRSEGLAKYVQKGAIDLKNIEASQAKQLSKVLDRCRLCMENDNACPMISMAEKVYLSIPPDPSLVKYSAMIIPMNHVQNTIHCDEDEWEEIRNYMISLSKFYYTKLGKSALFYECSVRKHNHAAIMAVPIPMSLSSTIPGFFKQAILEQSSELDQHHRAIIKTDETSGSRPDSFRYSIAKEAPYFHVWYSLSGGMGHIVEDVHSWPRGDLFAREVIGGVLGLDAYVIKDQGRWKTGGDDERVGEMIDLFLEYDWTEDSAVLES